LEIAVPSHQGFEPQSLLANEVAGLACDGDRFGQKLMDNKLNINNLKPPNDG